MTNAAHIANDFIQEESLVARDCTILQSRQNVFSKTGHSQVTAFSFNNNRSSKRRDDRADQLLIAKAVTLRASVAATCRKHYNCVRIDRTQMGAFVYGRSSASRL